MRKGKKASGGRYRKTRKKKKIERTRNPHATKLEKTKRKQLRIIGGNKKTITLTSDTINIINPKTKKSKKTKIKNVIETPSNRFWARQNILTKGAIIETELGKAKITNRPSQEGVINGVLIEEKEK